MSLTPLVEKLHRDMQDMLRDTLRQFMADHGIAGGMLSADHISGAISLNNLPAHHTTHETGGTDALTGPLDANARVAVSHDGTLVGTRRDVNFITGPNVTVTVADNPGAERVDVTITATGGGGSSTGELLYFNGEPLTFNGDGVHFG